MPYAYEKLKFFLKLVQHTWEGQLWIGRDLQLVKKLKNTEKYLPESTILGNTEKEASPL